MSQRPEQKNLGLVYDLLVRDGSPTAAGLAAMIAGGAALGAGAAYAIQKIVAYFSDRERDLEAELEQLRQARTELEAADVEKSAIGAHGFYR